MGFHLLRGFSLSTAGLPRDLFPLLGFFRYARLTDDPSESYRWNDRLDHLWPTAPSEVHHLSLFPALHDGLRFWVAPLAPWLLPAAGVLLQNASIVAGAHWEQIFGDDAPESDY